MIQILFIILQNECINVLPLAVAIEGAAYGVVVAVGRIGVPAAVGVHSWGRGGAAINLDDVLPLI
jgi:hypothetical protein